MADQVWSDSHGALWQGDVRACLAQMDAESVQVAACSPPYHQLRAYGTQPQVWGGDPACSHDWAVNLIRMQTGGTGEASAKQVSNGGTQGAVQTLATHGYCWRCQAWSGELGSEPTVAQYIANLVEVFAAVKRVLRNDGTLWVNLGSSYAGSGKGPTGWNGIGDQEQRQGFSTSRGARIGSVNGESGHTSGVAPTDGYKSKDLMQIPTLVFHALQRDGWWLRSVAPWIKRNGMPESCTDRPTHSLEWIGLFSKSERYFYDADAGRVVGAQPDRQRRHELIGGANGHTVRHSVGGEMNGATASRNRRNTDWYFDALDAEIEAVEAELAYLRDLRANGGVRLGDDGLPLAFDVNPQGFDGAHFATWPPNLVKPMLALSTSERGACAACGAPHKRVVEKQHQGMRNTSAGSNGQQVHRNGVSHDLIPIPRDTMAWAPTCACGTDETRPCVVLDPFAGSSTTLLVARQLGRIGWGIELQPDYVAMSLKRLRQGVLL